MVTSVASGGALAVSTFPFLGTLLLSLQGFTPSLQVSVTDTTLVQFWVVCDTQRTVLLSSFISHNLPICLHQVAGAPAYAMVGAASTLAAVYRAPLTSTLLLFELTKDYDILLPLMASAGVSSLIMGLIQSPNRNEKTRAKVVLNCCLVFVGFVSFTKAYFNMSISNANIDPLKAKGCRMSQS